MILLNDRALARHFRQDLVTRRQLMLYLLAWSLLTAALLTASYNAHFSLDPAALTPGIYINDALLVAYVVLGILLGYRINNNGDGADFIARYSCLGLLVTLQSLLIMAALSVALGLLYNFLQSALPPDGFTKIAALWDNGAPALLGLFLYGYCLYRLLTALKIAAAAPAPAPLSAPAAPSCAPRAPTTAAALPPRQKLQAGLRHLRVNAANALRLSFLRPAGTRPFHFSWHVFWLIFALYALTCLAFHYFDAAPPRIFYYSGLINQIVFIVPLLAAAYLAALINKDVTRTPALLGLILAGLFVPLLVANVIPRLHPEFFSNSENANALGALLVFWYFLVAAQALSWLFHRYTPRTVLGALLLTGAILVPQKLYYPDDFRFFHHQYTTEPDIVTAYETMTDDELFALQDSLIAAQADAIEPSTPGTTDSFAVILGGWGLQEVFRRDTAYVKNALEKHYGLRGRTLLLLNNEHTVRETPLATTYNLARALRALAAKMQDEDILLLYLTSHGSAAEGVALRMRRLALEPLGAPRLAALLQQSGIRNQVLIISACYSGAMIAPLKSDHRLILTAAAADKTSFGCSDDVEMPYFAEAYFKHALPREPDLIKAFALARAAIAERENAENLPHHSDPQIHSGAAIESALAAYEFTPHTPEPFGPPRRALYLPAPPPI